LRNLVSRRKGNECWQRDGGNEKMKVRGSKIRLLFVEENNEETIDREGL